MTANEVLKNLIATHDKFGGIEVEAGQERYRIEIHNHDRQMIFRLYPLHARLCAYEMNAHDVLEFLSSQSWDGHTVYPMRYDT